MATTQRITTAEQLWEAGDIGPCELVRGEVIMMTPSGGEHSRIGMRIAARLDRFAEDNHLGVVLNADCGFVISRNPDTVRSPDVAFLATARAEAARTPKYVPIAPDLAVEVVSPSDRTGDVLAKVQEWLEAGCQAVWVVDPPKQMVFVYRRDAAMVLLQRDDVLRDEILLPGFSVTVREVFEG
jgi:Uma2 family endonuclease